jgi:hypothetical protein
LDLLLNRPWSQGLFVELPVCGESAAGSAFAWLETGLLSIAQADTVGCSHAAATAAKVLCLKRHPDQLCLQA